MSQADPAPGAESTSGTADGPRPGDPAAQELAEVEHVMTEVRAVVRPAGATPEVPSDDEVAGLERAHEALRSTLDRVDRKG